MSSNTIKTLTAISKEISRRFDARADVINSVNRQYDKPHAAWGANSGSSIQIKKPQQVSGTASATLDIQDITEQTATLTVNNDYHVGLAFTAAELTQDLVNPKNMKMFADDYLDAAIDDIIAKMQTDLTAHMYKNTYNSVGTPGTGPTSYQVVTQARAKLNYGRAPRNYRSFLLGPDDAALLNNAQSGLFHYGDAIGKNYKEGSLAPSNGFQFLESPDVSSHTTGDDFTGVAVNGTMTEGSSTLTVDGITASQAPNEGDIFTIADVYSVDPVSGASTGNLQQFVVGSGATITSLPITPSLTTTGALKTINALPADDAALTFVGSASSTYPQGMAYHKDAFVFATAELADIGVTYEVPIITGGAGDGYSQVMGPNNGVYMKLYMDGDITNRRAVARLDVRYGYTTLIPQWATRVQGA